MSIPVIFDKQLLINNIMQLCPDVINIVKEYLFYKRETVYKNKKYKMIEQIHIASSRFTQNLQDNNSRWIFWAISAEKKFNIRFQGNNCLICGNCLYICYHRKHNIMSNSKIFCPNVTMH